MTRKYRVKQGNVGEFRELSARSGTSGPNHPVAAAGRVAASLFFKKILIFETKKFAQVNYIIAQREKKIYVW